MIELSLTAFIILNVVIFVVGYVFCCYIHFPKKNKELKEEVKERSNKYRNCKIEYFPNVKKFAAKYGSEYIVIWFHTGEADTMRNVDYNRMFKSRKEVLSYLDRWLELKGVGTKIENL